VGDTNFDALFQRFFPRAVRLTKQVLHGAHPRAADEEDIALSALKSLCLAILQGRIAGAQSDEDLWRLVRWIARRKAIDYMRREKRQKRGAGKIHGESVFHNVESVDGELGLEQVPDQRISGAQRIMLEEERKHLFEELEDETLRQVATWKIEGFTNDEIAKRLGVCTRTVERKLKLIRKIWSHEPEP
jgi:RNA polymerase sigma factor (sigma-70 family)